MTYETILVERDDRVATITLNRPKALNALKAQVMNEVTTAAAEFDNGPEIGAIIITGSPKAFAAGADIKEMADLSLRSQFACPPTISRLHTGRAAWGPRPREPKV